jgi:hypothetical protein
MFEQSERAPAGVEWCKVGKGERIHVRFAHGAPCASYYRATLKDDPRPATEAPGSYEVTDVYVVEATDARSDVRDPRQLAERRQRLLAVERTLRVAVEREAARVRWCTVVARWPEPGDDWVIAKDGEGAWQVACFPRVKS